jgi:hypothetical protein
MLKVKPGYGAARIYRFIQCISACKRRRENEAICAYGVRRRQPAQSVFPLPGKSFDSANLPKPNHRHNYA